MRSKFWFLQFFGLSLVLFGCTDKKTALDQYFEGVNWESMDTPDYEIKISNGKYHIKNAQKERIFDLTLIDDKRLRRKIKDKEGVFYDTLFVSVLNLTDKKLLVLHDSLYFMQFFKSDQLNEFPTLDNHDKVDLSSLNLGVSIGQIIPIDLLKYSDENTLEGMKLSGIARSGQTMNGDHVDVDLSSENRVLSITQLGINYEAISNMVDNLTDSLGFPPRFETVDTPNKTYFTEKKYVWNQVGLKISLYLNFYLDTKVNRELNRVGKRLGTLMITDEFLTQVEIFKANFLPEN